MILVFGADFKGFLFIFVLVPWLYAQRGQAYLSIYLSLLRVTTK